jgi:hypothetical protein
VPGIEAEPSAEFAVVAETEFAVVAETVGCREDVGSVVLR